MNGLKLKTQLLKKIEIQNSSALRKIDGGKSYYDKKKTVQCKLRELNNSIKNISRKLKAMKKKKIYLKKNSRLLRQVIKTYKERF